MKRLFLILVFCFELSTVNAQQIYQRLYENNSGGFTDIVQNPDSTYTLLGTISTYFYLLKIDDAGNTIWEKFFRPSFGVVGEAQNIFLLSDGYLITGGATDIASAVNNLDYVIAKTDTAGNPQWLKRIDSTYNDNGSMIRCFDGSYFMTFRREWYAGSTFMWDYNIVKLDSALQMVWAKKLPQNQPTLFKMMQLHDSCVVSSTYHRDSANQFSTVLFKMDLNGNYIWQREVEAQTPGYMTTFRPQFELPDGTIVWSGFYRDTINGDDHGLVYLKTDSNGYATSLTNFYPINPSYGEYDGKAFIVNSNLFAQIHGSGILLIDSMDNIVDEKEYFGLSPTLLFNYLKRPDSTYFFIGVEVSAGGSNYIAKTDTLLTGNCYFYYRPFASTSLPYITTTKNFTDTATSFTELYGFVTGNPIVNKYLICNTATDIDEDEAADLLSISPNPFNGFLNCVNYSVNSFYCKIMDVTGKVVKEFVINANDNLKIEVGFVKPDIYFLTASSDNLFVSKKIIKLN